jgi:hypothetical protein
MMTDTLRVLYVDDEPGLLDIGNLFLEKFGDFTVTTAPNAPDAIRLSGKFLILPGSRSPRTVSQAREHGLRWWCQKVYGV